jgi:two-component system, NarL family, nitrate/nitrite response regulator NarL
MPSPRTTVVVADDHPLFRDGIVRAVRERPDLELVGEAKDGRDALAQLRTEQPAAIVLDLALPGLDGLDILAAVRHEQLATRVLILSASTDGALVHQAISAGAAGYLSKRATRVEVCDAVAAVARGELVLEPQLHPALLSEIRALSADDPRPALTAREQQILVLMADGLSAPAIAAQLVVSPTTVKTHMGHMYEKLGVSDRAACVAEAMRCGLLE